MDPDVVSILADHGVQASAHRVAVARYVLHTEEHPSADQVWTRVRAVFPIISRATVYNTLHLFVAKGLLRELVISPGKAVFDPNVDRHHHFIDEDSGKIHDVPWGCLRVSNLASLKGFDVREYQVVMRGRRPKSPRRKT